MFVKLDFKIYVVKLYPETCTLMLFISSEKPKPLISNIYPFCDP